MSNSEASAIIREFLLNIRPLDSEVYAAIRVQYLASAQKEEKVA